MYKETRNFSLWDLFFYREPGNLSEGDNRTNQTALEKEKE
jgi:hypothetical protein